VARAGAFVAGLALGFVLATGVMVSHGDEAWAEILSAAEQAGVDPAELQGAVDSTGLDPFVYLRSVGELAPLEDPPEPYHPLPPTQPPRAVLPSGGFNYLVECIIAHESRGYAYAVNPYSGAAGLGQFLRSTWSSTPQGRAGLSVFDPVANRSAIAWMLAVGRGAEFVGLRGC
jgi:hypothetical protein